MSINPKDFLDLAEELINKNNEIGDRNAISRSYYGLYHSVSKSLKHCPNTTHAGLISYLKSSYENKKEKHENKIMRQLAAILESTKKQRQIADYDLDFNINKIDAEKAIILAKKGISLL